MNETTANEWKENEIKNFLKQTEWRCAADGKGRTYYYHKGTKKTQWNKPEELVEYEKELDAKLALNPPTKIDEPIFNKEKTATLEEPVTTVSSASNPVTTTTTSIKLPLKILSDKLPVKVQPIKNPFNISGESDDEEAEEEEEEKEQVSDKAPASHQQSPPLVTANASATPTTTNTESRDKPWRFSPDHSSEQSLSGDQPLSFEQSESSIHKKPRLEDSATPIIATEENIIQAKDSFINPLAIEMVNRRIRDHPEEERDLSSQLISHYEGYYQMSKIVMEWLSYADHLLQQKSPSSITTSISALAAFGTSDEKTIQSQQERKIKQILCEMLANRFNRKTADSDSELQELLEGDSSESSNGSNWLGEALADEQVMATIQSLHRKYPDSQFLSRCMNRSTTSTTMEL